MAALENKGLGYGYKQLCLILSYFIAMQLILNHKPQGSFLFCIKYSPTFSF